jgi:hypothetical protein
MSRLLLLALAWSTPAPGGTAPAGNPDREAARDETALLTAGLKTDNSSLLQFFRSRTLPPDQRAQFRTLVRQLGSSSYKDRTKASADLVKMGPKVKGLLQSVKKETDDRETVRRAELCLHKLAEGDAPEQVAAVARLVARRQPAGAAEVLLDYLSFAADPPVLEEVRSALAAVAAPRGKPDPVLVKALHCGGPLERAAAAEALCRARVKGLEAECAAVLKERDPELRLPVALALLEARRPESLPALIDLVRDLPPQEAWKAEEALRRVAGEQAPRLTVCRETPGPKVCAAWRGWLEKQGKQLDLARVDLAPRLLGYTLLSQMDAGRGNGRVLEMGPDKKVKWEIPNLLYPVDAQVVGPDRVLIAEYLGRRVSERDFKGKILWEKEVDLPIACQRLPNGQTFVASRRRLFVLNGEGKEVFTYDHAATSIGAARKLPDGQTVFVAAGQCVRLDPQGKQVKSFPVGMVYNLGGNIDVLPNGWVLVPEYTQDRVAEYDTDGKLRWTVKVRFPTSAVRLPNGNTLVVSLLERRAAEYTRDGREVWNFQSTARLWRARKR